MVKRYLVTGCAGFIASSVTELLLDAGHLVVGVDNLNDAYDPRLKHWRLARLKPYENFRFHPLDITDRTALAALFASDAEGAGRDGVEQRPYAAVVNLAARAGVQPSVENPWVYVQTNCDGHAQPAGPLPAVRRAEVPAGLHVEPLRQAQRGALPRGRRHEPAALALRRLEERRPRPWPTPTITCTGWTFRSRGTSRSTARPAGPT